MGYYVFALSPLSAAELLAREVIRRGQSDGLVWLVQGYHYSERPDRLVRIKEVVALKHKSRKLVFWLRRILDEWADNGDKEAERLLAQLPVIESE